jgi:hypothetical protein
MGITEILLLVVSFFILLALGVPIAWTLGIASLLALLVTMDSITAFTTLGQQFLTSLDSFTLLAIPFFILAGQIMNQGGIANRLIDFAKNLVGSLPGGLAQINVVAAMLFGSIAGSSVAAASAIGSILGPKMEREGYTKEFGAVDQYYLGVDGSGDPPFECSDRLLACRRRHLDRRAVRGRVYSGYFDGTRTDGICDGMGDTEEISGR